MSDIRVQSATKAVQTANEDLMRVVERIYPIGRVVDVQLGAHLLTLKVVGHGQYWWSSAGEIYGENIKSGKVRTFHDRQVQP